MDDKKDPTYHVGGVGSVPWAQIALAAISATKPTTTSKNTPRTLRNVVVEEEEEEEDDVYRGAGPFSPADRLFRTWSALSVEYTRRQKVLKELQ